MNAPRTVAILDAGDIRRCLTRIAHEILERNRGSEDLAVIGIQTGGVPIARRLASLLRQIDGHPVPCGVLDARAHRDDIAERGQPESIDTDIPFDIADKVVVLVDEVLYTGRTIRAAMDALVEIGRPQVIQLAVLIDRGHRELPIRPDFVGRNIPTHRLERVCVEIGVDSDDRVYIERPCDANGNGIVAEGGRHDD